MSDEFPLPRSEEMLRRVGQHPAIEILDVDEETIYCKALDVETALVADLSDQISGYSNRAHVWEPVEDDEHGMHGALCHHMKIPLTWLPNPVTDDMAWRVSADEPERANIPCSRCKQVLSERQDT